MVSRVEPNHRHEDLKSVDLFEDPHLSLPAGVYPDQQ